MINSKKIKNSILFSLITFGLTILSVGCNKNENNTDRNEYKNFSSQINKIKSNSFLDNNFFFSREIIHHQEWVNISLSKINVGKIRLYDVSLENEKESNTAKNLEEFNNKDNYISKDKNGKFTFITKEDDKSKTMSLNDILFSYNFDLKIQAKDKLGKNSEIDFSNITIFFQLIQLKSEGNNLEISKSSLGKCKYIEYTPKHKGENIDFDSQYYKNTDKYFGIKKNEGDNKLIIGMDVETQKSYNWALHYQSHSQCASVKTFNYKLKKQGSTFFLEINYDSIFVEFYLKEDNSEFLLNVYCLLNVNDKKIEKNSKFIAEFLI